MILMMNFNHHFQKVRKKILIKKTLIAMEEFLNFRSFQEDRKQFKNYSTRIAIKLQ
jgi:hypothetical protein